jgi:hypothetical protein
MGDALFHTQMIGMMDQRTLSALIAFYQEDMI